MALYNQIGKTYDSTRRADPYLLSRLLHHLQPVPEELYLDVACGTGNYTIAIAETGVQLHGFDLSEQMLSKLRKKSESIPLFQGDVEAMLFEDQTYSGAICTLATHHFPDLYKAFKEIYRVLKPGRFVIFTATPEQMKGYWLNEYFPDAMEKSIVQMPDWVLVESALTEAGFANIQTDPYDIREDLQDLFLYSGKHRPRFYLDEKIRSGISTFSSLADPDEVERGLKKLEQDIESGDIERVIASYQYDQGDYLFVVSEKLP